MCYIVLLELILLFSAGLMKAYHNLSFKIHVENIVTGKFQSLKSEFHFS